MHKTWGRLGMTEPGKKLYGRQAVFFLNGMVMLAAAMAAAVLLETLFLPVLQIIGSSMEPALHEGDFVVAIRYTMPKRGDIVAFYSGDKILVKRVIALPGEQINIDRDGKVSIDGELLEEPYLQGAAFGMCDIKLPCQVMEGTIFVMGDNRGISVDSRSASVGCVREGQLIGKVIFRFGG
ncbi:signal peptidase I [Lachnospiraceae bacterium]|nr:signal peptidase I [Lachnospiraceae bacterium]